MPLSCVYFRQHRCVLLIDGSASRPVVTDEEVRRWRTGETVPERHFTEDMPDCFVEEFCESTVALLDVFT